MADRRTIKLVSPAHRERAKQLIDRAPDGYVSSVGEETRSDVQNRMMWPLIKDIREQVPGHGDFSPDDTKLRFLHALGQEMRFLPELDGGGMFPVGQRSSVLSKSQFAMLLNLILAFGDKNGVVWSLPSQNVREEAKEAA